MLANLSLFVLQKVEALNERAGNGVPYWMYACFMIDTVCILLTGNRGLGGSEGQLLGSVPGDVVKNAVCGVILVQTSALDEDRMFAKQPAEATDGPDPG